jgi:hypothetical protein
VDINWSAWDALLAVLVVGVVIWAAFNLVKRLIVALIAIVVIAVVFFGAHIGDFGLGR